MTPKQTFLNAEIWILSFGGAFQRANVYVEKTKEKDRTDFRNALINKIEQGILPQYNVQISEKNHTDNIKKLIHYSKEFKHILNEGQIRFGVAQKLLNLYLKYQWCLGNIHRPPHFPVDRIIQLKLKSEMINWTTMTTEEEYMTVINNARAFIRKDQKLNDDLPLAEWELENFNRR